MMMLEGQKLPSPSNAIQVWFTMGTKTGKGFDVHTSKLEMQYSYKRQCFKCIMPLSKGWKQGLGCKSGNLAENDRGKGLVKSRTH